MHRVAAITAIVAAGVMIAGCISSNGHVEPGFEMPCQFSETGEQPLPQQWWLSFNDPRLNELMEEALSESFTIRSAWDRLAQAEQVAARSGASLWPQARYQAGARRNRIQPASGTDYTTEYSAGLSASFELDLWGRLRSSAEAGRFDAIARREDLNTAAITLTASVGRVWYQLNESMLREGVLDAQLHLNEQVLEVVTNRNRQGTAAAADVYRQQQLIHATTGQLIKARERTAVLSYQLSILLARSPDMYWQLISAEMMAPEELPSVGLPAEVMQRRPDVNSALAAVMAADARTAAAVADMYPSISLSAGVSSTAPRTSELFDKWLANLAANVAGPIFDAGQRRAEANRTRAVLSQAINDYRQTLLVALREVEDALAQEAYQRDYIDSLRNQLELARQVYDRTRASYIAGRLDYIRVLDSLESQQRLELTLLEAQRILAERRIDLCRAISGGWEMHPPAQAVLTVKPYTEEKE